MTYAYVWSKKEKQMDKRKHWVTIEMYLVLR